MRDALGGTVNITIIVLFIVIALGYMAFNVNYTKAFRMKDKIISTYEEYNGECESGSKCQQAISSYAKSIGYQPEFITCPDNQGDKVDKPQGDLYCLISRNVSNDAYDSNGKCKADRICDKKNGQYYTVITKVNIDLPIIRNILDINAFKVSGDTKALYK